MFMKLLANFSHFFPYGVLHAIRKLGLLTFLFLASFTPVRAEIVIAALGDSLTQGYGLPENDGFVPQLQTWLSENGAKDVRLINAGVSGDTTAGGLSRIDWTLDATVDALIVTLGGNDLLRGIEPANSRSNIDAILSKIDEQGIEVLLVGMPAPTNYGPEYKEEFDAIYPDLAARYDTLYYPNFMAGLGDASDPSKLAPLMQDDFLHPNAQGVVRIVEAIGPVVIELAERIRENGE